MVMVMVPCRTVSDGSHSTFNCIRSDENALTAWEPTHQATVKSPFITEVTYLPHIPLHVFSMAPNSDLLESLCMSNALS